MSIDNPSYVIEGGIAGRERLRLLATAMRPLTEAFLDRLDITPGMRCLDVGCGGGDVTRLLAQRCGTTGTVVGIDNDPTIIDIARDESDAAFIVADGTSYVTDEPFDLVYARFFLSHVTDARATLGHLLRLLRPGGTLAIEDVWFPGHFCFPQCKAFDMFVRWYRKIAQMHGADPDLGLKLPTLFDELNVMSMQSEMHTQAFGTGIKKTVSLITLERIRMAIVYESIANDSDVVHVIEELFEFTERSDTIVSMAPVMQISGRSHRS